MERMLQIVVLETPTLSHQFLKAVRRQNITVTMSDQSGQVGLMLSGATSDLRPDVLRSQINAADTPDLRLKIARQLIERAVIEASRQLSPGDFVKSSRGPYRLVIPPHAAKRLLAVVYRLLALSIVAHDGSEPAEYRVQILRSIRSLRRFLSNVDETFVPFRQQAVLD